MSNNVLNDIINKMPMIKPMMFPYGALDLQIMIPSVGCEDCRNNRYDWHGLRRGSEPFVMLQHTISGQGKLNYHGKEYSIGAGDTMLLTIPDNNRYWLPKDEHWMFFWINFNGPEAMRLFSEIINHAGPVQQLSNKLIETLASYWLTLANTPNKTAAQTSLTAYSMTMSLVEEIFSATEKKQRRRPPAITRVIEHVHNNLDKLITVQELAQLTGYSRHHFCRIFKESEGISPIDFIQLERMHLAVKLLQTGNTSVKAVSAACGYSDPNYFAKAFRRTYKLSPSEFLNTDARPTADLSVDWS